MPYNPLYYQKNKEKILAQNAEWRKLNPERKKETDALWQKNNPEKANRNSRTWQKKNPEKILIYVKKSLQKYGLEFNMNSLEYKSALYQWAKSVKKRDNHTCQNCGSKQNLHAHHIKTKKEYPKLSLDIDNGITKCERCHVEIHHG